MRAEERVSIEFLRQALRYDGTRGTLEWVSLAWASKYQHKLKLGPVVLHTDGRGYPEVRFTLPGGRRLFLKAHRMAWAWTHGRWPEAGLELDHINGHKADFRLANLREVDRVENQQNTKRQTNNTSGRMGVTWAKRERKWTAGIVLARRQHHLGYFDTFEAACAARAQAEERLGFHPNHGRAA